MNVGLLWKKYLHVSDKNYDIFEFSASKRFSLKYVVKH